MNKKRFIFILILILISICLTGCKKSETPEQIDQKTSKELGYFEERIFEIVLKLEKNDYLTPDNTLDWKMIVEDTEKIDMEIDNIILDLSDLDVSNEKISNVSMYMNNVLLAINEQNETNLINQLNNLYQLIPKYLENFEKDKNSIRKKELKAIILNSFVYGVNGGWESAKNEVDRAQEKYNEMISDNDYLKDNAYNINKVYILIQEYKTSVYSENFELARLRFVSLSSEI